METTTYEFERGVTLDVSFDVPQSEILMKATIPIDSYFAIGFGATMDNTDMIVWRSKGTETFVDNLFSLDRSVPQTDGTDYLESTVSDSTDGKWKIFETKRKLDTGNAKDYAISLDRDVVMCYAMRGGGDFRQHSIRDNFILKIAPPGSEESETPVDLVQLKRNP